MGHDTQPWSLTRRSQARSLTALAQSLVGVSVRSSSHPGSFISAAAAPYNQRALPPSNLDTNPAAPDFPFNYHVYQVIKPLTVNGGPIAPWFGQPGLGAQFYTGDVGNIMSLISQGYLERKDPEVLISKEQGCVG